MVLGKLINIMEKINLDHYLTTCAEFYSICVGDLDLISKYIKHFLENRYNPVDIDFKGTFSDSISIKKKWQK